MVKFSKHHLHSEQFDGWLHAQCGSGDVPYPNKKIVGEDEFEKLPRQERCRKCAAYYWPHGGEGLSGSGYEEYSIKEPMK